MVNVKEIRYKFLDYFKNNGHEIIDSSPLVPQNDPSLLFTNSGMVQFKNVFTGSEVRPYKRAVTTQKCVRAGGKHNDLDNVGYTTRHHTFFEMLGNFSFGDYFKDIAIELAWNLITKEFCISPEKLLVTIYHEDHESELLWKKIAGLSESKIVKIKTDDNFWRMGEFGPCGPCSEIFYDHGEKIFGGPPGSKDEDGDRFVEIWNLVFMQYEENKSGKIPLPKPSIDTGMGLERISAILQGKSDNYEIDLIKKIILESSNLSNTSHSGSHKVSHRVIADHLRSTVFLIADGVMPSNEGRGYVLRRIMRRAMRHVHMIGVKEPFMNKLVPVLLGEMGDVFQELQRAEELISTVIIKEEEQFSLTLERGLNILEDELIKLGNNSVFPGEIAFKLYDTYGFPLDLTQDVLKPKGKEVDLKSFETQMQKQKDEARAAWKGSGESVPDEVWFGLKNTIGSTKFNGYNNIESKGEILAIIKSGEEVEEAEEGATVDLILDKTPFYGESGGQVGDSGKIMTERNGLIFVENTVKYLEDLFVHKSFIKTGVIKKGDKILSNINQTKRFKLAANHSATHLLHAALREVLGDHISQKGSLVNEEKLRFDISHPNHINKKEITMIENLVNSEIRNNQAVTTDIMKSDEAKESGALALFGEKYGDEVRVVSMGSKVSNKKSFSTELCGGTHVKDTGDIGLFKIVSESSVSSGVRRIEAVTGHAAIELMNNYENILDEISDLLKTSKHNLKNKLYSMIEENKKIHKDLVNIKKSVSSINNNNENYIEKINNIKLYSRKLDNYDTGEIRHLVDEAKKTIKKGVVIFFNIKNNKVSLFVGVTDNIIEKINAIDLSRILSAALGGKGGGGRPDFAQAGGTKSDNIDKSIIAVKKEITKKLKV